MLVICAITGSPFLLSIPNGLLGNSKTKGANSASGSRYCMCHRYRRLMYIDRNRFIRQICSDRLCQQANYIAECFIEPRNKTLGPGALVRGFHLRSSRLTLRSPGDRATGGKPASTASSKIVLGPFRLRPDERGLQVCRSLSQGVNG